MPRGRGNVQQLRRTNLRRRCRRPDPTHPSLSRGTIRPFEWSRPPSATRRNRGSCGALLPIRAAVVPRHSASESTSGGRSRPPSLPPPPPPSPSSSSSSSGNLHPLLGRRRRRASSRKTLRSRLRSPRRLDDAGSRGGRLPQATCAAQMPSKANGCGRLPRRTMGPAQSGLRVGVASEMLASAGTTLRAGSPLLRSPARSGKWALPQQRPEPLPEVVRRGVGGSRWESLAWPESRAAASFPWLVTAAAVLLLTSCSTQRHNRVAERGAVPAQRFPRGGGVA